MSKGKESKINLVTILIIPIAVAINWVGGTLAPRLPATLLKILQ